MEPVRSETAGGVLAELRAIKALLAAAHAPPALLERDDVARLMRVGVSTFDRLRAAGEVGPTPVRVGGGLRWCRAEVLAWLERPAPDGELFDAREWPVLWADQQRRKK